MLFFRKQLGCGCNKLFDLPLLEPIAPLLASGLIELARSENELEQGVEVFSGMIEINDMQGMGEVQGIQVPGLGGTVSEARFGRISDPRCCWAPKGTRPAVPLQLVREYTSPMPQ